MNELALFAGDGGGILGGKLLGWTTVCAVEIKPSSRRTLMARQDDGCLDRFPVWDDIRTFDGCAWRGVVDIVTGGFPCQGISAANDKPLGLDDSRSGLWSEQARIIREVGPRYVLVENSPMLTSRGLGRVLGDLAAMGYDARWGVLGAADAIWRAGDPIADHERHRIWILAVSDAACERRGEARKLRRDEPTQWSGGVRAPVSNAVRLGRLQVESQDSGATPREWIERATRECTDLGIWNTRWWATEPGVHGVADGVAHRVDRLHGIGNGQVPEVVRLAWHLLQPNENQGRRMKESNNADNHSGPKAD